MSSTPPTESRRPISQSTPVTVGLVIVILGGIVANMSYMHTLEAAIDGKLERYVTRDLFEARITALSEQISDLKAEIRRK